MKYIIASDVPWGEMGRKSHGECEVEEIAERAWPAFVTRCLCALRRSAEIASVVLSTR